LFIEDLTRALTLSTPLRSNERAAGIDQNDPFSATRSSAGSSFIGSAAKHGRAAKVL
jgi:hypothetical protein